MKGSGNKRGLMVGMLRAAQGNLVKRERGALLNLRESNCKAASELNRLLHLNWGKKEKQKSLNWKEAGKGTHFRWALLQSPSRPVHQKCSER